MVISTTDTNRIFFKDTHIRCGLPGIQKLRFCSFQKLCNRMGISCDTAHSLQIIQCDSFAGKQRTDISSNNTHQLSFFDFVTVFTIEICLHIFIQNFKYSVKYIQPGNYSILFADQLHLSGHRFFHHRIGGHVLTGNIFLQCFFDQMVYI